jgi:bifunctional non-homologous end joining protein LigD
LVTEAPSGDEWAHELKFDGYRMHARLDRGDVRLLTRTGLDWTGKYPAIAVAVKTLPARQAYLDGELCGVRPDGVTSFALIQNAADRQGSADLVYFVFDLLHLDDLNLMSLPLADRRVRLAALLERRDDAIRYSDHQIGQGLAFHQHACALGLEGIVSKRLDAPYSPGDRGLWLKTKCLNREEFVVVGWTEPQGGRPFIGGYYDPENRLPYAGRVGIGTRAEQFEDLLRRLRPLQVAPCRSKLHRRARRGSIAAGAVTGALGAPRTRRRGQISDLGRRTASCARSCIRACGRTTSERGCPFIRGEDASRRGGPRGVRRC